MRLEDFLITHKKPYLIFDFDETLFELVLPWENWEKDIESDLANIDAKIIRAYRIGAITLSELQNEYVAKDSKALELLINHNIHFETTYLKNVLRNEELVKFIKETKGYKLYLWTSNTKSVVENVMEENHVLHKFDKIITRDDVKMLKPNTEGFYKIYDEKIPKSEYLLIGDSDSDKDAAESVGIDFFLVDYFTQT